jgi:hypothetical protein
LTHWIDTEDFAMDKLDISAFQTSQASGDIPRLPLTDHYEKERRHEQVIRSFVDQNYVMLVPELAPQMCRRNHAAAAAAQYDNLLSPVESEHFG